MPDPVDFTTKGAVGVITIDNPPVNALSQAVRQGIMEALERGLGDGDVKAMVIRGSGRNFIAGADIREFGKPALSPTLREVIAAIEASPKLVVAALHGSTLGGGLEIALGCNYRCAAASASVGFPEVKLGLIPGAGGTQRLPRVAGIKPALEMITGGGPIAAARAHELDIIDEIVDGELMAGALAYAERLVAEGAPLRKVSEMDEKLGEGGADEALFADFRKGIEKRARGYLAPWKCIESVQNATKLPFAEGLARERELFRDCMEPPHSPPHNHVFCAARAPAKIPDVPKDVPRIEIARAAVIGAGTMGGGIAMSFANAGIPVQVLELSEEALEQGLGVVRKNYSATVARGRLAQGEMDRRMALITPALDYDAIGEADIVIEAVFEEMDLKKQIFGKLDEACKAGAILATNTSTLDVDEIAAVTSRPELVIGTHFFSPANVMRLLEIVRGARTSSEVIATTMALARTLGKVGVLVGVCDGFVGNRMLACYRREANFLLEEGALPRQLDRVIYDFGFAMGPFAVSDLTGLDVSWRIRKRQQASRPKHLRYSPIADKICEMGRFGQKTGAGWYRYESGSRTPLPDPEIEELIIATSQELGIERRRIGDEEIIERCLYALINEGAKILEEGLALRSSDIDIVYIYGYGFPVYRGGPMFYADRVGLRQVYESVCRYHEVHGEYWEPAPLLEKLAGEGKGFGDLGT